MDVFEAMFIVANSQESTVLNSIWEISTKTTHTYHTRVRISIILIAYTSYLDNAVYIGCICVFSKRIDIQVA